MVPRASRLSPCVPDTAVGDFPSLYLANVHHYAPRCRSARENDTTGAMSRDSMGGSQASSSRPSHLYLVGEETHVARLPASAMQQQGFNEQMTSHGGDRRGSVEEGWQQPNYSVERPSFRPYRETSRTMSRPSSASSVYQRRRWSCDSSGSSLSSEFRDDSSTPAPCSLHRHPVYAPPPTGVDYASRHPSVSSAIPKATTSFNSKPRAGSLGTLGSTPAGGCVEGPSIEGSRWSSREETEEREATTSGGSSEEEPKKLKPMKLQFYKTKLCPWVQSTGLCRKGSFCRYAHGEAELRPLPDLSKTRMCDALLQKGTCPKGSSCKYAHHLDELRATTVFRKTKLCPLWQKGICIAGNACRFAHGLGELRLKDNDERQDEEGDESSSVGLSATAEETEPTSRTLESEEAAQISTTMTAESQMTHYPSHFPRPSSAPQCSTWDTRADKENTWKTISAVDENDTTSDSTAVRHSSQTVTGAQGVPGRLTLPSLRPASADGSRWVKGETQHAGSTPWHSIEPFLQPLLLGEWQCGDPKTCASGAASSANSAFTCSSLSTASGFGTDQAVTTSSSSSSSSFYSQSSICVFLPSGIMTPTPTAVEFDECGRPLRVQSPAFPPFSPTRSPMRGRVVEEEKEEEAHYTAETHSPSQWTASSTQAVCPPLRLGSSRSTTASNASSRRPTPPSAGSHHREHKCHEDLQHAPSGEMQYSPNVDLATARPQQTALYPSYLSPVRSPGMVSHIAMSPPMFPPLPPSSTVIRRRASAGDFGGAPPFFAPASPSSSPPVSPGRSPVRLIGVVSAEMLRKAQPPCYEE